jgi:ATPase family protein associated with various cellular activities (AAA)
MVISSLKTSSLDSVVEAHLKTIFHQLQEQTGRFGIGEADPMESPDRWYPPNAFHTYWTLEILEGIKNKYPTDYERLSSATSLDLLRRREGMLLWSKQQLGRQLGLHSAEPQSSLLDTDQLAWSLAIFLRFDRTLNIDLETQDFLKQAFKCLFSTQKDGTWRHYKPLFHYQEVGNAYSYVFETFAALLRAALRDGNEAEMVRSLLAPYSEKLLDLWRHAESTKTSLSRYEELKKRKPAPTGEEIGWSSGHRINHSHPESWATASVFSYAQSLRRLVGIWCREQAYESFVAPQSRLKSEEAAEKINQRGETWGINKPPVSEQLQITFINPVRMHKCDDRLEPDSRPIGEHQARSAILFGPPGTSKTSLVRYLADVVSWDYVEIHASHFVAEGLAQVQKTADKIFRQLLEMDHTVVLFDEIDELVRERDIEKDAFGRFLTTSMLPKLAELWNARKILYFVATNHINYFDSAIIRSHRFDALTFVGPPSLGAKVRTLTELLSNAYGLSVAFNVEEKQVDEKLKKIQENYEKIQSEHRSFAGGDTPEAFLARWREEKLESELVLAKFALLRHDELDELAYRIATILTQSIPSKNEVSTPVLEMALGQIADSEWRKRKSYIDYLRDARSARRDYQMLNAWEIVGATEASAPEIQEANDKKWLTKAVDALKDIRIPGFEIRDLDSGSVEVLKKEPK